MQNFEQDFRVLKPFAAGSKSPIKLKLSMHAQPFMLMSIVICGNLNALKLGKKEHFF